MTSHVSRCRVTKPFKRTDIGSSLESYFSSPSTLKNSKRCKNTALKLAFKELCRPRRPPKWLILLYSQPRLAGRHDWDQIHPLTQLALQPVEWRNAATSSLCDIPHTIMHGPSSASHGSLHTKVNHMGSRGEGKRKGGLESRKIWARHNNRRADFPLLPLLLLLSLLVT